MDEIEKYSVGMERSFKVMVTDHMVESFCNISGDYNELHRNADYAKEKGFRDKVVYGMLTGMFFSTVVGMYIPGKNSLMQSVTCDFLKPVYIGDNLEIRASIKSIHKSVGQIQLNVEVWNQEGVKVVVGKIKTLLI